MIKLFCLPYAGSSASFYFGWRKYLIDSISLQPVELSGRGRRFDEPLYLDFEEAIADVIKILKKKITEEDSPYMLFGHSMGALISFEIYHKLFEEKLPLPIHVFFSGKRPPIFSGKRLSSLPDNLFLDEIRNFGGTPSMLFENKELLSIFLPILKADIHMIDSYQYRKKGHKLHCAVDILCGLSDNLAPCGDIGIWKSLVDKKTLLQIFDGNHFFIHANIKEICNLINIRAQYYLSPFQKN